MRAREGTTRMYLYVNGLALPRALDLGDGLTLEPVDADTVPICRPLWGL